MAVALEACQHYHPAEDAKPFGSTKSKVDL